MRRERERRRHSSVYGNHNTNEDDRISPTGNGSITSVVCTLPPASAAPFKIKATPLAICYSKNISTKYHSHRGERLKTPLNLAFYNQRISTMRLDCANIEVWSTGGHYQKIKFLKETLYPSPPAPHNTHTHLNSLVVTIKIKTLFFNEH